MRHHSKFGLSNVDHYNSFRAVTAASVAATAAAAVFEHRVPPPAPPSAVAAAATAHKQADHVTKVFSQSVNKVCASQPAS